MSNVRPVEFRPTVNATLIDMLERLMAQAKAGEIVSGNFAGTSANGEVVADYSDSYNAVQELASVARLLHRLHIRLDAMTE